MVPLSPDEPPNTPAAETGSDDSSTRHTVWSIVKRMWTELHDDGLFDAAAGVAFWLILSLPAALLAVLSSVSLLGNGLTKNLRTSVNEVVERTFTTESETIRNAVNGVFEQPRPGVLSASVFVAVFTLSRGFAGLIRALDVAYDIEESRKFIRLRATAIGMALGTLVTVAGSTALWVFLDDIGVPGPVRLLAALTILIVWAATMFHIGPHHRTPWRYDLPGAALTAVGWLAVSIGFGYYVQIASTGNEIVGAAGTALLALTWLWLTCLVFLIGAELNEILAERAGVVAAPKDLGIDIRSEFETRVRSWRRRH